MPRKPRVYIPGMPCHIIQRGNNREACFFTDEDFAFYLNCLGDACERYRVSCHAYVLMTNHVHLLLTPADSIGVSKVMQSLGRCYVQYVNKTYRRCGTLWQGRHKSSLVDAEAYLLSCYRYIELNPVTAGMVDHPADYKWSSYRHNAYGELDLLIAEHPLYLGLSNCSESRMRLYRELFSQALPIDTVQQIRRSADFSMPLGDERFMRQIEGVLGRKLAGRGRGRPRSKKPE